MEPMEHDSTASVYRSPKILSSPSASPVANEDVKSDVSDMEIDQNSPPHPSRLISTKVRASSSLDYIKSSLEDILSFKNDSNQHSHNSLAVRGCQSVPPFASLKDQNTGNDFVYMPGRPQTSCATFKPVHEKSKTGYGLNESDNDLMFSHFPNSTYQSKEVVEKSLRNRLAKSNLEEKMESSNSGSYFSNEKPLRRKKLNRINVLKEERGKKSQNTSKRTIVGLFYAVVSLFTLFLLAQYLFEPRVCGNQNFFQSKALEIDLKSELFGQHIASELIFKHLNDYFKVAHSKNKERSIPASAETSQSGCRPLVLSFHGWTGVGKNFASHIISQSFTSVNVHLSIIPLVFPHIDFQSLYGQQIEDWIKSNVTHCSVNLFIIDEMDKAYPEVQKGLLRAIESMVGRCSASAPIVFVIISNTHAALLNQVFVEKFHLLPSSNRLEMKADDFHSVFSSPMEEWYRDFSTAGVIDKFIPFLPLERQHVIDCIKRDLISKHYSTEDEVVSQVLEELSFTRLGELDLSTTGCKRVSEKVDYVIYSK